MARIHTELTFEGLLEEALLTGGFTKGYSRDFDAQTGLFLVISVNFLKNRNLSCG
jgi:type I restriction enzyme R subunit